MNGSSSSSSNNTNLSLMPPWYTSAYNVIMVVLYTLIIIGTILGNVLVCCAVAINPSLRKNISVYFIVSLALSDICTACFSMSFDLETYITYGEWHHNETLCSIWTAAYLITVPTSMWTLFALSITRYKMLKSPWDRFRDAPFLTPKRAVIVIVSLWVFCLAIALVPIIGVKYIENPLIYGYCIFNISPAYANVVSFLSFYFPMFSMCFIYYKIYMIARTQYVIPSGLETRPNVSGADMEPEMPSRCSVDRLMELEQQNGSKDSSKTSLDMAVGYTRSVDNGGLELDNKEAGKTRKMDNVCAPSGAMESIHTDSKDRGCYSWKHTEEDGKNNKNMDNLGMEKCKYNNRTQTSENRCPQNTCTNRLCDVEEDYDCHTYTDSKPCYKPHGCLGLSTTEDQDGDNIIDTAPGNKSLTERKTPELAAATTSTSTSSTNRCKSQQIMVHTVNELESNSSGSTDNATALISPCSSDAKDVPNDEVTTQEEHNSLGVALENNLSASKTNLANELTKRRKVFVKNKKAARTIAIIVSAFLVCWVPFTTHSVILNVCSPQCLSEAHYRASQILLVFGYLNSVMNPIIFSYKDEQFLRSYRKIMKVVFFCSRH